MFHVQQHFPGDLAKPALAESEGDSCSFLCIALFPPSTTPHPPKKPSRGQEVALLIEAILSEDLQGLDGQDRAV